MLDLKKLEEKLDKVLDSETTESLENWLSNKRLTSRQYTSNITSRLEQSNEILQRQSPTTFIANLETKVVATIKSIEPKVVEENSISEFPQYFQAA